MQNNQQLVQEINAQRTTIEDKFEEVAALQQLADTVNGNNPKKLAVYVTNVFRKSADSR